MDATTEHNLRQKGRAMARATMAFMRYLAMQLWGDIIEQAPVDHGRLSGSFSLSQRGALYWEIRSGVEYLRAVHEGTGPRMIEPVNKKALRFVVDGNVIFAKRVMHPGTRANPFIDRAIQNTEGMVETLLGQALREEGLA